MKQSLPLRYYPLHLLLLSALLVFVFSCKKQSNTEPVAVKEVSVNNNLIRSYHVTDEKVAIFPSDKEGNGLAEEVLNGLKRKATQNRTAALCSGFMIDPFSYQASFQGHYAELACAQNPSANSIAIRFKHKVEVPANLLTSGSTATIQFPKGTGPIAATGKTFTITTLGFDKLQTYYDASLQSDINIYEVTSYVTMSYQDFCSYQTYRIRLTLHTDCPEIEYFATSYTGFNSITPGGYQAVEFTATGSSSVGFNLIQPHSLVLACMQHCHFPSLGYARHTIFEYRKLGSTAWETSIITGISSDPIDVTAFGAGTYEYRTRSLIYTSPEEIYSPNTYTGTVVVP